MGVDFEQLLEFVYEAQGYLEEQYNDEKAEDLANWATSLLINSGYAAKLTSED